MVVANICAVNQDDILHILLKVYGAMTRICRFVVGQKHMKMKAPYR